ncbi:unnamed protein product [Cyprideis torosa]|uniref:Uncharacterized protein n=1 Tax=Cyprideis torosa TaxID=163714 RepID=A0A7R8ZK50_9CRUS|nr:unnamed protein product [Cyprideis torosa]CAG0888546.1 unnamed protein product [Cyprideis torosa]
MFPVFRSSQGGNQRCGLWTSYAYISSILVYCVNQPQYNEIPDQVIQSSWDPQERPRPEGDVAATKVDFKLYVFDINSINPADMDFRVDFLMIQSWTDYRLNSTVLEELQENQEEHGILLPAEFLDLVWKPDPIIPNAKEILSSSLNQKFASIRVFKNGMIRYMIRLYVLLACQMDFRQYPYDVQICPMMIESFSNPNDVVKFAWEKPSEVSCHNNDDNNCSPVRLDQGVKLLQYALAPMVYSVGTARYDEKQGIYTQLKAEFRFSRELIHHLFQTYVPSTLIVCLAWFSFFMGLDAIPGRATLLVTSMLTLVTMFANSQTFPPATYVKGMDIWMMACLLFKFLAIAEFITVKRLKEMYDDYMKGIAGDVITVKPFQTSVDAKNTDVSRGQNAFGEKVVMDPPFLKLRWIDERTGIEKILWKQVDIAFRYIYPLIFITFQGVYWSLLLKRAF